ncbi:MAG: prepilin-type N-terminal cleavage/methylation domain-containing protein [Planctomycetales bacterium]|nr:prepilin-type N-terminal cleavage/methylation domain-containing protein [Planctomycetales bacterium]NIP69752.1 prepilin-type N-terminal cleavage/methylation domain-containing protein [Planctomycetales bacterium]
MKTNMRQAFTLIEILIVVVIMAILAATIIPQFTDSTADAELATTEFNLNTLRAQIELYKVQHGGAVPAFASGAITGLTTTTTHNSKDFGPYLVKIPTNTITGSDVVVEVTGANPIAVTNVTGSNGWLYHSGTGEIRIDHLSHWDK